MDYAMLAAPGQSRVYFDEGRELFRRELGLLLRPFGGGEPHWETLGGRDYLCFSAPELPPDGGTALARSSAYFALFQREGALLRPVTAEADRAVPDRITSMLKYNGKTAEQFTRLLVNLAVATCAAPGKRPVLMDPLCGRGTTLFEAMTLGLDAVGVELSAQACKEGQAFLTRFLKDERYKHEAARSRPRDSQGRQTECLTVTTARDKAAWKQGETRTVRFFHADTLCLEGLIARESVHMIVTDLPYGVQHGSHQDGGRSRGAVDLVRRALPVWSAALKPGGVCVLAFNEYTTPWAQLAEAAQRRGFTVLTEETPWQHRVAEAIHRNLIVLRKER